MTASAATEATRSWEQYLQESAVPRSTIDDFIQRPNWATFDPELGYILHDCLVPWGADDSRTIETFRSDGARSRFLYAGRKPRINSYGNSFTECTQVSDGETWQEYLAGHLGEPIGNFGVGGHGVYQAYRRMRRVEQTADGAPYVILYVWGEDPVRSIMRCRWAVFYPWVTPADHEMRLFSSNPWAHLEIDLETGSFTEVDNPLPTPESVYAMCDPQWMLDHLRDDLAMQLAVYAGDPGYGQPGRIGELDRPKIERLAELLNFPLDWGLGTDQRQQAAELLHHYGQRATTWILDKASAFTRGAGKTLLVALNYTARTDHFPGPVAPWDGTRRDQEILDYLSASGIPLFDMNDVHQREYDQADGPYHEYLSQYMNGGHYNPRGTTSSRTPSRTRSWSCSTRSRCPTRTRARTRLTSARIGHQHDRQRRLGRARASRPRVRRCRRIRDAVSPAAPRIQRYVVRRQGRPVAVTRCLEDVAQLSEGVHHLGR